MCGWGLYWAPCKKDATRSQLNQPQAAPRCLKCQQTLRSAIYIAQGFRLDLRCASAGSQLPSKTLFRSSCCDCQHALLPRSLRLAWAVSYLDALRIVRCPWVREDKMSRKIFGGRACKAPGASLEAVPKWRPAGFHALLLG